jgi:ABC-2 type transport system ATP-binding protein
VLGADPEGGAAELRDRVGIVLQESGVDPDLTVRETLDLYGAAYSRRHPTAELIDLVGLGSKATRAPARCRAASGAGSTSRLAWSETPT